MNAHEHICKKIPKGVGLRMRFQKSTISKNYVFRFDIGWHNAKINFCPFCGLSAKQIIENEKVKRKSAKKIKEPVNR